MDRLTEKAINEALADAKSLLPSTTAESLTKWKPSNAADPGEIVELIREVELSKQLRPPLTDQQVAALTLELRKFGFTIEKLRQMGDAVKRRNTYGTIALEYWIEGEMLTSEEVAHERRLMESAMEQRSIDFKWEVEKEIRRRIERAKRDQTLDPLTQELIAETAVADEITRLRLRVAELERS